MKRLFVLLIENNTHITKCSKYFLPKVKVKDYKVINNGRNIFDQPVKHKMATYENKRKVATGQRDDYTTGSLLNYWYLKENDNLTVIDLSKSQVVDADPKAIKQINFIGNIDQSGKKRCFSFLKK